MLEKEARPTREPPAALLRFATPIIIEVYRKELERSIRLGYRGAGSQNDRANKNQKLSALHNQFLPFSDMPIRISKSYGQNRYACGYVKIKKMH